jgi:hypothetical protein
VRIAWAPVVRASRAVRRAAVRVWRALDCAWRFWRVAAARRAAALRCVLVRERWLVERLRLVVERLEFERLLVERPRVELPRRLLLVLRFWLVAMLESLLRLLFFSQ